MNTENRPLIISFFEENGFVKSNIDSYNSFIEWRIQKIVDYNFRCRPWLPMLSRDGALWLSVQILVLNVWSIWAVDHYAIIFVFRVFVISGWLNNSIITLLQRYSIL